MVPDPMQINDARLALDLTKLMGKMMLNINSHMTLVPCTEPDLFGLFVAKMV